MAEIKTLLQHRNYQDKILNTVVVNRNQRIDETLISLLFNNWIIKPGDRIQVLQIPDTKTVKL